MLGNEPIHLFTAEARDALVKEKTLWDCQKRRGISMNPWETPAAVYAEDVVGIEAGANAM
jgi:hypothetical protein